MLWMAAIVIAGANFMAVLDLTIANVSVPNIAGGLEQAQARVLG
jgi:DHA2 family multidrug resistance protein